MKENVIIVNCKVASEAFQILSMLRRDYEGGGLAVSHAAIVKKEAGKLSFEDGFVTGEAIEGRGWTGGLIGSLVGILGGPLGVLFGASVGELIGDSMDIEELEGKFDLLEKVSECLADGETALLMMAQEENENALSDKLKGFQITITRMDAEEIAKEIENAEKQKIDIEKK